MRKSAKFEPRLFSGVAKKEERWRVEVQRRAVDLGAECFGVQPPAVGPWQRALHAAGGVLSRSERFSLVLVAC